MLNENESEYIEFGLNYVCRYILNKNKEKMNCGNSIDHIDDFDNFDEYDDFVLMNLENNHSDKTEHKYREYKYREYIKLISEKYSGYSWTSFVTNIRYLFKKSGTANQCILFSYVNLHLENLMKINITHNQANYLIIFYDTAHKLTNQIIELDTTKINSTNPKNNILLQIFLEILKETIHLTSYIILKCDYINDTILNYKSLIYMKIANQNKDDKNNSFYDEFIAFSYFNLYRMRDNGLISF